MFECDTNSCPPCWARSNKNIYHSYGNFLTFVNTTAIAYRTTKILRVWPIFLRICNNSSCVRERQKVTSIPKAPYPPMPNTN